MKQGMSHSLCRISFRIFAALPLLDENHMRFSKQCPYTRAALKCWPRCRDTLTYIQNMHELHKVLGPSIREDERSIALPSSGFLDEGLHARQAVS